MSTPRPSPPKMPPQRPVSEPTMHEQAFGFQDQAFNDYMKIIRVGRQSETLEICVNELAQSDHPIVQHAAGSAAMELAFSNRMALDVPPAEAFARRKGSQVALEKIHRITALMPKGALVVVAHPHHKRAKLSSQT